MPALTASHFRVGIVLQRGVTRLTPGDHGPGNVMLLILRKLDLVRGYEDCLTLRSIVTSIDDAGPAGGGRTCEVIISVHHWRWLLWRS